MELRTGKADANVLDRSVRRRLGDLMASGSAIGSQALAQDAFRFAMDPVTADTRDTAMLAVTAAVNDLAADGFRPVSLETVILLPPGTGEKVLRDLVDEIRTQAEQLKLRVQGGHTEVTDAVTRPVVIAGAYGMPFPEQCGSIPVRPGMAIVATKWAALEASFLLAREKRAELLARFPLEIVRDLELAGQYLGVIRDAQTALRDGASLLVNASEGGIFAALWELSQKSGLGFSVELSSIPLRQEAIEAFDYYGQNPYEAESAGMLLAVTPDPDRIIADLADAGIRAGVIGYLQEGRDKLILNGDEKRCLERPAPDSAAAILHRA